MRRACLLWLLLLVTVGRVPAQSAEVQQLLLNVEKLAQLRQLLSDMKEGYQVLDAGYTAVREVTRGNFNLHEAYLDGLLRVSPAVRRYHRIAQILAYQVQLVRESEQALARFRRDGNLSPQELFYLGQVQQRLLRQSLDHLEALRRVLTDGQLRMGDADRLQAIDGIFTDMQGALAFLRDFHRSTRVLALQRAREQAQLAAVRRLYGITP